MPKKAFVKREAATKELNKVSLLITWSCTGLRQEKPWPLAGSRCGGLGGALPPTDSQVESRQVGPAVSRSGAVSVWPLRGRSPQAQSHRSGPVQGWLHVRRSGCWNCAWIDEGNLVRRWIRRNAVGMGLGFVSPRPPPPPPPPVLDLLLLIRCAVWLDNLRQDTQGLLQQRK